MGDESSWRTAAFRQSVVAKIDEAIRQSGMNTSRNSIEMENHVFQKAKNKEEYLGFVARLILHVREMNQKKPNGIGGPGNPQSGPGMPDPINALQNLASQGTRNPMMNMNQQQMVPQQGTATNLLQTLNRPQQPIMMPIQGRPNMGMQPNQMMPNQMQGQMPIQMRNPNMMQQMPNHPNMMMNPMAQNFPRGQNPQNFIQSHSPSVQSPAGLSQPPVASPALAPSPGSQMCGSMLGAGPPRSVGMAPSPSSLNTPGQPGQSPMGGGDEQAYREKVRQLSKYIEPLRKMITRMGNDDVEKMSKMKKLLEILSNPQQRMPMETLIKCEVALERLDFKRGDSSVPLTTTHLLSKEHHVFNPLLEAVSNNLQSSVINHTLHRTFGPTLEALFGPEMKLVPPLKRQKIEEPTSDIPDVLQGEIARLDPRFKVSLDSNQQPGSKSIKLTCWLDDKNLPCVPPVSLTVPENYPTIAPTCHMTSHEYNATQFLSAVQSALLARIKKLPKHFSVSQLLDTWEMSVRQASAPKTIPVNTNTILMGL